MQQLFFDWAERLGALPGGHLPLSLLPYYWRIGFDYKRYASRSATFQRLGVEQQREWILGRIRTLVRHADLNIPFYQKFYRAAEFSADDLHRFEDIQNIPIITKQHLQEVPEAERGWKTEKAIAFNTGGTSGQPLSFHAERHLCAKEAAYFHSMWARNGFRSHSMRLCFRGGNLGDKLVQFSPPDYAFMVNAYMDLELVSSKLEKIFKRFPVAFLHGYPSVVYAFASHWKANASPSFLAALRKNLRGVLLGSEYPLPIYRSTIEEVCGVPTYSWYGHSEMAVLAGENGRPFEYEPFQSYGYSEAVAIDGGTSKRLVTTNYDNFTCPFIRYDTGDLIEPTEFSSGILQSFKITEGRVGDFVLDANGQRISLTALIFGRHHKIFSSLSALQVAQNHPGKVLILATRVKNISITEDDFWKGFDACGLNIDFELAFLDQPVRTRSGKVPLKAPYPESTKPAE
jgi:phenylacetate-CoA ligase